jgi:hypothetical protein
LTVEGWETAEMRKSYGLKKSSNKMSNNFEAHNVDSWVLANSWECGHDSVDNKSALFLVPYQFHRRQLHKQLPKKGGIRHPYGSTRSLGFKRGSFVKHPKYGLCYVGGTYNGRITIHDLRTKKRLSSYIKPEELEFKCYSGFRIYYNVCLL